MKEDWERERTAALSEMFDNVDENGIYPTTKLYERLDKYVASLLTKRIEQAVAEERMRVREVCEDLKCSVDHSMDIQIDTRIYHDGYNQAIEHIAAALQDPRRGGESV